MLLSMWHNLTTKNKSFTSSEYSQAHKQKIDIKIYKNRILTYKVSYVMSVAAAIIGYSTDIDR